jgi:hypothetical protein
MIPNSIPTEFSTLLLYILFLIGFILILFLPTFWELKHPKDAGPRVIPSIAMETANFFLRDALQKIVNMDDGHFSSNENVSILDCLKGLVDLEIYL